MAFSLSYAQLYTMLAGLFRRFNLSLFETTREMDIDVRGGGPLGEPSRRTQGIRVRVNNTRDDGKGTST